MLSFVLFALASVCSVCSAYDLSAVEVLATTDGGGQLALHDAGLAYKLDSPQMSITMTYNNLQASVVSELVDLDIDFAAISSGLTDVQAASFPTLQYLPILAYALVPVYRLDALSSSVQLVVSRPTLARIYMGQVTWWNDSSIQADNGLVVLPQQRITMVLPQSGTATNLVWLTALAKFDDNFTQIIDVSSTPVWPTSLYYDSYVGTGAVGQASQVLSHDGSIGFAYQSVALEMGCSQAAMINQAGNVVQASAESVTFAAVELGTRTRTRTTAAMDLTDGSGSSVWPISMMTFLLIDTTNSRSTCAVREAVVEFWLWFFSSSVAAGLLATREYAPVPSIVLSQLAVLNQLQTQIMCRGTVAYPPTATTSRILGAPSVGFVSSLFASLYLSVQPDLVWTVQTNSDEVTLQQLVDAEIDVAFVNFNNVPSKFMDAVTLDTDYLLLPTYLYAPAVAYNPQLTSNVSIAGLTVTLDMGTVAMMLIGCIENWNDQRVLAQNPWLAALLPAIDVSPVPFTKISSCGPPQNWPLLEQLRAASLGYTRRSGDDALEVCISNASAALANAIATCTPYNNQFFVTEEASVPPLMLGIPGSVGVIQAAGNSAYGLIVLTDYRDGVRTNTTADVSGMSACAYDTFDAAFLSSGQPLALSVGSTNLSCYSATQQVTAVLRTRYSSTAVDTSNCDRGYDALQFLSWFYSTASIDELVNSVAEVRVSSLLPKILSAYTAALQAVTCDGETLLVTQAVPWTLSSGIASFVYALSAMGVIGCLVLCGLMWEYRTHPIVRSASPLFLLLSVVGVAFIFGSGFALVSNVTTVSCSTFSWLLNFGLLLSFAPLFAKTWRIYRIFGRKKLSVVAISNRKLLSMVVVLVAVELLLMAIWQAVGELQPIASNVTTSSQVVLSVSTDTTRLIVDQYVQCGVPAGASKTMFIIVVLEKGCMFVFGALMAFTTRKVKSTFNESSGITLAIYNVCFTVGIIAPIILVIDAVGDVLTLLLAFALLWIAYFTGGILFVPKMLQIFAKSTVDGQENSVIASSSSSSGYVFMSLASLSTLPVLRGYHAALQKHIAQVEKRINGLRGTPTAGPAVSSSSPNLPGKALAALRPFGANGKPATVTEGESSLLQRQVSSHSHSSIGDSAGRQRQESMEIKHAPSSLSHGQVSQNDTRRASVGRWLTPAESSSASAASESTPISPP